MFNFLDQQNILIILFDKFVKNKIAHRYER